MDRLGTQARQAARTEPAAARRDRHDLRQPVGGRAAAGSRRTSATSSRSTPTRGCRATRRAAWSARWRTRSTGRASTPQPAAWSRATPCCSRGSRRRCRSVARARCSSASSPARAASIRMPPPSPTSTRICSAKARTPARASTTSTPSRRRSPAGSRRHAAQPRSVRGHLRARRSRLRHRGGRGVSVALRRRRRAPAPLGARRLAVAALDLRARCGGARTRLPLHRPLEDARQSAAHAVGARHCRRLSGRLAAAAARRAHLDRLRPADHRAAGAAAGARVAIVPRRAGINARSHSARAAQAICGLPRRSSASSSLFWRTRHG